MLTTKDDIGGRCRVDIFCHRNSRWLDEQRFCPRAKHQTPIHKSQRSTKASSRKKCRSSRRHLEFEDWSFVGVWVLVLGVSARAGPWAAMAQARLCRRTRV